MKPSVFVTKPLYGQVRDTLAANIADGTWAPGSPIPNEVDLSRSYGVSVGTMRKALGTLEEEGLLTRRQGRGTFVADQSSGARRDKLERLFRDDGGALEQDIRQISSDVHTATSDEQTRLSLQHDSKVLTFRQLIRVAQAPAIYREAHVPAQLLGDHFSAASTWDIFSAARKHGFWIGSGSERIRLVCAEPRVAVALGVSAGTKLIMLDRLVCTLDGQPLEWLVSWSKMSDLYYEVTLL